MTPLVFLALAAAGGVGAVARLTLDGFVRSRTKGSVPWGTILINLSGSLVLGVLVGLLGSAVLPAAWEAVLGIGFMGGYTTFSTASFETVRLLQERRWGTGIANGLGVMIGASLAAGLGLWIGGLA